MKKYSYQIKNKVTGDVKTLHNRDEVAGFCNSIIGCELVSGNNIQDYFTRKPRKNRIDIFKEKFTVERNNFERPKTQ
jgi:hypothetical protein|tara:strand:- start:7139 stop:7369 length:231 start_codon:yes stop_codon:yes gene_type:complete